MSMESIALKNAIFIYLGKEQRLVTATKSRSVKNSLFSNRRDTLFYVI